MVGIPSNKRINFLKRIKMKNIRKRLFRRIKEKVLKIPEGRRFSVIGRSLYAIFFPIEFIQHLFYPKRGVDFNDLCWHIEGQKYPLEFFIDASNSKILLVLSKASDNIIIGRSFMGGREYYRTYILDTEKEKLYKFIDQILDNEDNC